MKLILTDKAGVTHKRDFTPRHFDLKNRELTLEFALHEHGAASDWARHAKVGDRAVIGGPRGSMVVPADYAWHVLAGDASALPAIHRRLQELPDGTRALVLVHMPQGDDIRPLSSRASLQVQWLPTEEAFIAALRHLDLPQGEGFIWCAGEAQTMAKVREVVLAERQFPIEATRISAYWKAGAADYHEPKEPAV